MSEDLTDKLPKKNGEILTAIKNLDEHVGKIDTRLANLEQKVDGLEKKFDGLEKKFDGLEKKFDGLEKKFDGLEKKFDGLEKKVDGLDKKVDERLHDTRPIWQKVVTDIGELQTGQKRLEEGQSAMREQMIELNSAVRTVNRDQIVINDVVRRVQLDFHTFDERLQRFINKRKAENSQT
jgi:chromosome segregation ATPase